MFIFKHGQPQSPEEALIEALLEEQGDNRRYFDFKLKESRIGQEILARPPELQRRFVLAAMQWHLPANRVTNLHAFQHILQATIIEILRRKLPFTADDLVTLLDWAVDQISNVGPGVPQVIHAVEKYSIDHELTAPIEVRIQKLISFAEQRVQIFPESARWAARLRELIHPGQVVIPIERDDAWSELALADLAAMDAPARQAWSELLALCLKPSASTPSTRWLKAAGQAVERIGWDVFVRTQLRWFPVVDQPAPNRYGFPPGYRGAYTMGEVNGNLLRALVWVCSQSNNQELARALAALALSAYRRIPGIGPRYPKIGNAAIWALGNMPGTCGVSQLALLKVKIKALPAQKCIAAALHAAAARLSLPPDEIEELSVPTYGLDKQGTRSEVFGEYSAELSLQGSATRLSWYHTSGKSYASPPKAVKDGYTEELKELLQAEKDIKKMLPAQNARIEALYLQSRRWTLGAWRERYLDHPLVGTLARRLVWKFNRGDRAATGIWWDGRMVSRDSQPLDWLDEETHVELWHPISVPAEIVLGWRDWLEEHHVVQPFKQAHREIYVLTDAEGQTGVYSNRFAAHILKQHQFHALCGQRGWKNKLRLMVDDICPPATRLLPAWGLRAEFWIESISDQHGTDTTPSGAFLYVATDQVRFYPIKAPENSTHAMGGGYHAYRRGEAPEATPLENIPALVFSEVMRDVDLFVGVASVGNDPNWTDGGRDMPYVDYWSRYSFGALSETAKTRRQVLDKLVPHLKIGPRCTLTDRFLVVRGDLSTYKIHLGSGNILMEPNDQYLCIVPAQGTAGPDRIYLPFEGDQTLSIILSKAFLLVDDTKIKDPTIVRQIKPT